MKDLNRHTHTVKNFSEKPPTSNYEINIVKKSDVKIDVTGIDKEKEAKEKAKESQIELQRLDCNCNDCAHLQRDIAHSSTQKGKAAPIFQGTCSKFEKIVTFIPGTCQLHTQACFLHRKDTK